MYQKKNYFFFFHYYVSLFSYHVIFIYLCITIIIKTAKLKKVEKYATNK